jgi:aryl-alcohol dehydrogenase-like predicted oxidoreductase
MEYRYLGNTGLQVSAIGFGNMINFKPEDEEVNVAIVKRALELGVNFFDTAEAYQNGEAELALGRAFKKLDVQREKIVVSTKLAMNGASGGCQMIIIA